MGRVGRERAAGSTRVFVRPVAMLAVGLAAGLVMWRVLMLGTFDAAAGPRQAIGAAAGPPNTLAETLGAESTVQ